MTQHSEVSLRTLATLALILGAGAASIVNLHPGDRSMSALGCVVIPAANTEELGIEGLIRANASLLDPLVAAIDRGEAIDPTPAQRAAMDQLDAIAHQRDALWSRLLWHTDLNDALAEAKARGVPVLSLRLLGRLDESLSCANSRYFRTVLYPNAEVSAYLRDHFVLHWHTVREAPVLTVDFGNGRKLTQTITGNSIHYVIAPDGQVVDALPGLYTPGMFLEELRKAANAIALAPPKFESIPSFVQASFTEVPARTVRADRAGALASSKMTLEFRTLRNVVSVDEEFAPRSLVLPESPWTPDVAPVFDARARSLALSQLAGTDSTPDQVRRTMATFEANARADSIRNHTELRPRVIALLDEPMLRVIPTALDQRVYDSVFLSPLTDQWAGLVDPDAFAGLWARDRFGPESGG